MHIYALKQALSSAIFMNALLLIIIQEYVVFFTIHL